MKAINWTVTAMLLRTLLILGASTFVGAIVLPLGADGTLPVTWAAWKPILAVGASASVAAEFLWIRTHLSQAAQALGLPSPAPSNAVAAAAKTTTILLLILGLGALVRTQAACHQSPAQVASDVGISLEGVACVLDVYAVDAAQGKASQAVSDAVQQCAKYAISEAQATGILASHMNAERKEGFVPRN